jgi:hypothetical protein
MGNKEAKFKAIFEAIDTSGNNKGAVHLLLSRFYPDFLQIFSRFILILS